jgi:hypothetical protein
MVSVAVLTLWAAQAASAKLPPAIAKEMTEAVLAVDKALGLESWPSHGVKPCVDRGSAENPTKDVTADDARRCAKAAVESGFPGLGKTYAIAVLMAPVGPITAVAFGLGEADGWAAPSCDPGRKCLPSKLNPATKWGKRVVDRQVKACAAASTIWLPPDQRACPKQTVP